MFKINLASWFILAFPGTLCKPRYYFLLYLIGSVIRGTSICNAIYQDSKTSAWIASIVLKLCVITPDGPQSILGKPHKWCNIRRVQEIACIYQSSNRNTCSHPVLISITPVSKLLTHITHTHPKIKVNAILELRANWELAAYYNGFKYGWADGKPYSLHPMVVCTREFIARN